MANILIYLTNHAILCALGYFFFSGKNGIICDVPQSSNPGPTCFTFSFTGNALSIGQMEE